MTQKAHLQLTSANVENNSSESRDDETARVEIDGTANMEFNCVIHPESANMLHREVERAETQILRGMSRQKQVQLLTIRMMRHPKD